TVLQAIRRGRRLPIPLVGPEWHVARVVSGLFGAPPPDHGMETIRRGHLADNPQMADLLGFTTRSSTVDVIDRLYRWPSVIHVAAVRPMVYLGALWPSC